MKKDRCLTLAAFYEKEHTEAQEAANKMGMVFGFSDPVVISLEDRAFKLDQEAQYWYWLARLHPKMRATMLRKAAYQDI